MVCNRFAFIVMFMLVIGTVSLGFAADEADSWKAENQPANLKAMFELLHRTIYVKKDFKQAAAMFQSLIPDEERAKRAMKDDVALEVLRGIVEQHKKMVVHEADTVKLAKPEQTVIKVHAATTEEIAKYEKGSGAFNNFPGGAKRLAEQVLRSGVVFYEVEFLEPGKDAGMTYHLFYWDGKQWTMFGPMWRLVR